MKGDGGWDVFPAVRPACLTGSLLAPTEKVALKGQPHEGMAYRCLFRLMVLELVVGSSDFL